MKKKYVFGVNLRYSDYSSKDGGYCVYSVYGEDPNCDMGGYHSNPFLGNVEGTFEEVLEYAANEMSGFYQWGAGGYITPQSSVKESAEPIIIDKKKKLKLERKAKLKKLIQVDLEFILDNLENLSKDELKTRLMQLKSKLE